MAAFASVAAADLRARAKTADNTWLEAYGTVDAAGTPVVRVLDATAVWRIVTDDAAV